MEIVNALNHAAGLENAARYYHSKWGNESNFDFFYDAFKHSHKSGNKLPRFYLLIKDELIIGCCGLIIYDFVSCGDYFPWFAGLFIEESERGNRYGRLLLEHAENEAKEMGYKKLYLTTDHDGLYEKYSWTRIEDAYDLSGNTTRIYIKKL